MQGECADLVTVRAAEVAAEPARTCPAGGLYLSIHDELVAQVPAGSEMEALAALALLAQPFMGVPMRFVPVVLGRAWAKA